MSEYTHVGTLKSGRHTVLDMNKTFDAGDEVPLTEACVVAFGDKFDNIRLVEAVAKPEPIKPIRKATARKRKPTK